MNRFFHEASCCCFCFVSLDRFSSCSCLSSPLIQDLLNFDDPLNIDAAEHHLRDKVRRR